MKNGTLCFTLVCACTVPSKAPTRVQQSIVVTTIQSPPMNKYKHVAYPTNPSLHPVNPSQPFASYQSRDEYQDITMAIILGVAQAVTKDRRQRHASHHGGSIRHKQIDDIARQGKYNTIVVHCHTGEYILVRMCTSSTAASYTLGKAPSDATRFELPRFVS